MTSCRCVFSFELWWLRLSRACLGKRSDFSTSGQYLNGWMALFCVSCMQAVGWLEEQGASSISLYGDSSGATQVVQTLLLLSHRKNTGAAAQENTQKNTLSFTLCFGYAISDEHETMDKFATKCSGQTSVTKNIDPKTTPFFNPHINRRGLRSEHHLRRDFLSLARPHRGQSRLALSRLLVRLRKNHLLL